MPGNFTCLGSLVAFLERLGTEGGGGGGVNNSGAPSAGTIFRLGCESCGVVSDSSSGIATNEWVIGDSWDNAGGWHGGADWGSLVHLPVTLADVCEGGTDDGST
jgi:hypothetical protein